MILQAVNTETVRLPLVLTFTDYAFAVLVVTIALRSQRWRFLRKLDQLILWACSSF